MSFFTHRDVIPANAGTPVSDGTESRGSRFRGNDAVV